MDEQQAIAQLKRADIGGLETLVRMYQLHAVRAAYLVTHDLGLAEDIVQTAFVRVYERINQFDQQRAFGPWFLRMVVNDAVKGTQRRQRHLSLEQGSTAEQALADLLVDTQPAPDYQLEQAEIQRVVWEALGKLPPDQRAVIVQRYYLQMSEVDMADVLGSPRGTIKWRLHAARKRLQVLLRPLHTTDEPEDAMHEMRSMSVEPEEAIQ